ncbi:MAG: CBS domain-containing protein [Flavobacteriaceae bacterium]|nr:CBS domain-containing protein [Flavobacteriaceae bacterium]
MGEHSVHSQVDLETRTAYIRHLLNDLQALEILLKNDQIEADKKRIGAEQEFCLVNEFWRPSKLANHILRAINDPHFTNELATYNLEINLDPLELEGQCFSQMQASLEDLLQKGEKVARAHESRIILAGILPTISKNELHIEYMTPNPRYHRLNKMIKSVRGKDIQLYLRGVDELYIKHDSVLFEACNTSFQMHLQVAPDDFVDAFNWAQAISGPVLAIAANSPLLLGKELWSETRIGLFQQSIDTRVSSYALKEQLARVHFGSEWESGSIVDIYKKDISQFKILMANPIEENSLEMLASGLAPKLKALALHNGTVYRWNRPCYGVGNGKAHLRIENRYIPAGPTVTDQMANFAFWVGLMHGRPKHLNNFTEQMQFIEAKSNFYKAARTGKESIMNWMGKKMATKNLIRNILLPMAKTGLEKLHIDPKDIHYYLHIIKERLASQTGSQWMRKEYRKLVQKHKKEDALLLLTKAMYHNQKKYKGVHLWPSIGDNMKLNFAAAHLVSHIMTTQLYTLNNKDLANFALEIMRWKNISHILVEDDHSKLSGIVHKSSLEKHLEEIEHTNIHLEAVMQKNPIVISPSESIKTAIKTIEKHQIDCLPIIDRNILVGIITLKDIAPHLS